MNELRVSAWPIDKVIPFARNARKIPASAVAKVAASIQEFGWRQPIVVESSTGKQAPGPSVIFQMGADGGTWRAWFKFQTGLDSSSKPLRIKDLDSCTLASFCLDHKS